jgi:hypothetical protein
MKVLHNLPPFSFSSPFLVWTLKPNLPDLELQRQNQFHLTTDAAQIHLLDSEICFEPFLMQSQRTDSTSNLF